MIRRKGLGFNDVFHIMISEGPDVLAVTEVDLTGLSAGLYYILPLSDPDNVDTRRKSIGLPPLTEYMKQWNIRLGPCKI